MKWYYATVTFLPKHRSNEALVAKCLSILHGFSYRNETRAIGVSFPCWSEETIGDRISFVTTNKATLALLLSQRYFRQMKELKYFNISPLLIVPDNCDYASFKRNHIINKQTPIGVAKKLRRLEKRAIARGEIFEHAKYDIGTKTILEHYHSINQYSSSEEKGFIINIQMTNESEYSGKGEFSSYGLANTDDSYQTVPLV